MSEFAALPFFLFFSVLVVWAFYMVVKAAVRNGILEADVARRRIERQRRAAEVEPTGQA